MIALTALLSFAWADCVDYAAEPKQLEALEPFATKGALTDEQKSCLETSFTAAELQTTKDKISRVLLVNAYAYDTRDWVGLVQRHLDEVDRSDPEIAYLYAFHLFNNDKATPAEVIDWTQTALERKDAWEGATFVSRVYGLMRLRAVAALTQWERAEKARVEGKEAAQGNLDDMRNTAKTYAREWVDFAKVSGRSTEKPLELCLAVAVNAKACGVQEP